MPGAVNLHGERASGHGEIEGRLRRPGTEYFCQEGGIEAVAGPSRIDRIGGEGLARMYFGDPAGAI
ncbi:hypothetical protein D3C87_1918770 [compost metagenome]